MRLKGLCLALLLLSGCDRAPDTAAQSSGEKAANPALGARWQYPREREIDGRSVIVHAPQIRTWDRFEHFTAQVAIESSRERRGGDLRRPRHFRRHRSRSKGAPREGGEAEGRSRDIFRQRNEGAGGSHSRRRRARAARDSARRFPVLPGGWRARVGAARGIQPGSAADSRRRIAHVPALRQRQRGHHADRGHRPRDRRERQFPDVPGSEGREVLPSDRRISLFRREARGSMDRDHGAAGVIPQDSRAR